MDQLEQNLLRWTGEYCNQNHVKLSKFLDDFKQQLEGSA